MMKNLLRTMLVTAAMAAGTAGAWAEAGDETVNVDIDFSNPITDGVVNGTKGSMAIQSNLGCDTEINGEGRLVLGKGTHTVTISEDERAGEKDIVTVSFDLAFGKLIKRSAFFNMKDSEGNTIASFDYNCYNGILTTDLGIESGDMYTGYNTVIWDRKTSFTVTFDYKSKKITTMTACANAANKTNTHEVTMSNINPIATFSVGSSYDNASRRCEFDNLLIKTIEGDYTAATADYKVNIVCGDNVLKEYRRTGDVDGTVTLLPADTENFFSEDGLMKYIYVSDDAENNRIKEDGSTVVTVVFREAAKWTYNLNAVDGDNQLIQTLASGQNFEGETVSVPYLKYIERSGTLWQTPDNGQEYNRTVTLDADNKEENLTYTATDITNVAFYSEAEDIKGLSTTTGGNANIRCSGSMGAYNPNEEPVLITTLQPGKYKMTACVWGKGANILIDYGNGVWEIPTQGYIYEESKEIIVAAATDITMPQCGSGGSSTKCLDYIYIQKVGDEPAQTVSISESGYATFVAEANLVIPEGVTVYAVSLTGKTVTPVALTATAVIPAGTGLMVGGKQGDYVFKATEEAAAAIEGNDLKAAVDEVKADGTQYILAKRADGSVRFSKVKADTYIPAGKAYLQVDAAEAAGMSFLPIGGTVNGIENVEAETETGGAYYTLQGVRVDSPVKGVYIHNGKKVVIK